MPSSLVRLSNNIDPKELARHLQRDGGVIVESDLGQDALRQLNVELETILSSTEPGLRYPAGNYFVDFFGGNTIRIDGLPAKSKTFWELLETPWFSGVAGELLLPNCEDYLPNTAQLIEIGPGETAQDYHRDEEARNYFKPPKPLPQVEAMFALTDFTIENSATQAVPGSHLRDVERKPAPDEIAYAKMSAGSALVYLGTTLHSGGANATVDQWRRGLFVGFVLGWLRMEENTFLSVPMEDGTQDTAAVSGIAGLQAA